MGAANLPCWPHCFSRLRILTGRPIKRGSDSSCADLTGHSATDAPASVGETRVRAALFTTALFLDAAIGDSA